MASGYAAVQQQLSGISKCSIGRQSSISSVKSGQSEPTNLVLDEFEKEGKTRHVGQLPKNETSDTKVKRLQRVFVQVSQMNQVLSERKVGSNLSSKVWRSSGPIRFMVSKHSCSNQLNYLKNISKSHDVHSQAENVPIFANHAVVVVAITRFAQAHKVLVPRSTVVHIIIS